MKNPMSEVGIVTKQVKPLPATSPSRFLLMLLGRQQKIAQVSGFLPCTWHTWMVLHVPDFSVAQHRPLQPSGERIEWMKDLSLSPSFCLSNMKKRKVSRAEKRREKERELEGEEERKI